MPSLFRAVHPVLFAAYGVLFLFSQNLGEVGPADVGGPLAAIVAATALLLVVLGRLVGDSRRAAIILSAVVVPMLFYGHIAVLVAPAGIRGWLQQLFWLGLFASAVIVAWRRPGGLRQLNSGLNVIAAVLVVTTLIAIVPHEAAAIARRITPQPTATGGGVESTADMRDIYYLVFDRYGSDRALQLNYGIANDLGPWLEARGFEVFEDSHANYVTTSLSLTAVLNMTHLHDLAVQMGADSDDHRPVFDMLDDHAVGRFLKSAGYRYVHIGGAYGPTRSSHLADTNAMPNRPSDFADALYDTSVVPFILRRLGVVASTPLRDRYHATALQQLESLERVATVPGPKLVVSHLLLPHPPYTFDAAGRFIADDPDPRPEGLAFGEQLAYTNTRIRGLVDGLLSGPLDGRPIIVIQADEGPYPPRFARGPGRFDWSTATAEELEIKFGILNALYLPGLADPSTYPSMTSVNTFRVIFNDYFDAGLALLPDRLYTSALKSRPYDLADVTERLPSVTP